MDNLTVKVSSNFNLETFCENLKKIYLNDGFDVTITTFDETVIMKFDKGCGGINTLRGLGRGITASFLLQDETLTFIYSDPDWTGKIVGVIVGWMLCLIPFFTAIGGALRQYKLPNIISSEIVRLIGTNVTENNNIQNNSFSPERSNIDTLKKYKELLEQGIISEEEFVEKKAQLFKHN